MYHQGLSQIHRHSIQHLQQVHCNITRYLLWWWSGLHVVVFTEAMSVILLQTCLRCLSCCQHARGCHRLARRRGMLHVHVSHCRSVSAVLASHQVSLSWQHLPTPSRIHLMSHVFVRLPWVPVLCRFVLSIQGQPTLAKHNHIWHICSEQEDGDARSQPCLRRADPDPGAMAWGCPGRADPDRLRMGMPDPSLSGDARSQLV